MVFSRLQWLFWSLGILASAALFFALAMAKGAPDWYPYAFVGAAAYCLLAQATIAVIRWRSNSQSAAAWAAALATSRLGALVLLAIAVVVGIGVIFRPWR